MVIFRPKRWVNRFGKMSIFRLFEVFFLYSLERRFLVLEYHKRHFCGLNCLKKKKLEKLPFLDQNPWLTPLEKCQFFDFLNFLFLQPSQAFFVLENEILERKYAFLGYKNHFWTKTMAYPLLKIVKFFDFFNFLFF